MKRKFSISLLAILLIISLISCEGGIVGFMGKMGQNVAGVDDGAVTEKVTESVKVSEDEQTTITNEEPKEKKNDDGSTTTTKTTAIGYKDKNTGESTTLFKVGTKTTTKGEGGAESESTTVQIVEIAGIELPLNTTAKVSEIKAVLPPSDLSEIKAGLDGNAKEKVLEELSKPVEDEKTKEAVTGTATIIQAMFDTMGLNDKSDDEKKDDSAGAMAIVTKINDNLNAALSSTDNSKQLTNGDVVALKAITNVLVSVSTETVETLNKALNSETGESGKGDDLMTELVNDIGKEAESTLLLINNVSSTSSVFEGVDVGSILSMFTNK